jgi:arsenate reductase (glutaredoxin)
MESIEIWHNPRCGKSRETLALIENKGVVPSIKLYLKDTPTFKEIESVLTKLGMAPLSLIRTKEPLFIELYKDKKLSDQAYIQAMADHPILIERPIVIKNNQAILGRPPENVRKLL